MQFCADRIENADQITDGNRALIFGNQKFTDSFEWPSENKKISAENAEDKVKKATTT